MPSRFESEIANPQGTPFMVQKAERLVEEALHRAGLNAGDLQVRSKGDPLKIDVAKRLRVETTTCLPAGR